MIDDEFEQHRGQLFGIAYRMVGSAMEAEDIVQDAYLRIRTANDVRAPSAYLRKTVVRLCLDHLKSAAAQRETYIGAWLPEPLPTPDDLHGVELESISMAFLTLLETLSPVERAVFLLREVFDYEYDEIADIIGREAAACRQILHRAKTHIAAHRPRFQPDAAAHQTMLLKFVTAMTTGDLNGLTSLLAADAVSYSDGGGKAQAATRPIVGADAIARFFVGIGKRVTSDYAGELRTLNGQPAVVVRQNGVAFWVLILDLDGDKIGTVRVVVNPDKLRGL
ncbi:MAG: RNA polymerase sigma-70 factor [Chloroflexota bacterium]|nr:RNA polymerase sigma-70 factor [Chloroflexota bacterium]